MGEKWNKKNIKSEVKGGALTEKLTLEYCYLVYIVKNDTKYLVMVDDTKALYLYMIFTFNIQFSC